jgi:hypothetical protein
MLNRGMSIEDIFHALNTTLKRIIPFNMLALLIINKTNGEVSTKLFESDIKTAFNIGAKFNINDSLLKDVSTTKALLSVDDISDFPQAYPIEIQIASDIAAHYERHHQRFSIVCVRNSGGVYQKPYIIS